MKALMFVVLAALLLVAGCGEESFLGDWVNSGDVHLEITNDDPYAATVTVGTTVVHFEEVLTGDGDDNTTWVLLEATSGPQIGLTTGFTFHEGNYDIIEVVAWDSYGNPITDIFRRP